jgi:hypothetical protein
VYSCSPNASHLWNLNTFNYESRAIHPIRANDEITISYISVVQSRRERQHELLTKYAFKCACPTCILPAKESARSDIRRALLASQLTNDFDDSELEAWVLDPTAPDDQVIAHSEKLLGIMEEEGCSDCGIWQVHMPRLIKAYCALSNRNSAQKWAERAAVLAGVFMAADDEDHREALLWVAAHPEQSPWWGRRTATMKQ